MPIETRLRPVAAALASCALAGCASFSSDGGWSNVEQLTRDRVGRAPARQATADEAGAADARVRELLQRPLAPDDAVEVALLNHRGLQASFAELGIAEADLVRAGRLPNPSLRYGRTSGGGTAEIDRAVLFDVLALLTMPAAQQAEQRRFEQVQLQAAEAAVAVASEARKAYFEAVAAQQLLGYQGQVQDAADAANDLARRMQAAGNFSTLAQLREQAFHADAAAELARARHRTVAARERLARALGWSAALPPLQLPERLPDLPAEPAAPKDVEQAAVDRRLDVQQARRAADATARSLGLTRATRFVNVLDAGYQNKSVTGQALADGYEIELELPLFDFGTARVARAESVYGQAMNHAAQVALDARSEARVAYSAYSTAYELARHYRDDVVPLRKRISDENLLRYNGMLVSVFELLADAREQIASVTASVEALRDHWVAETELQTAIAGSVR